jgi:ornithine carbamoyltransferase
LAVVDVFVFPTAKAIASVETLSSNLPVINVLLPDFHPTQSYFGLVSVIT